MQVETLIHTPSLQPLNKQEERILEMYSRGESYEVIQYNLFNEYGLDYSNKKLGHRMGEIKKKMGCETQFQMGYLYGCKESQDQVVKLNNYVSGNDLNKGLNIGIVGATVFWLAIIGMVSNYIL